MAKNFAMVLGLVLLVVGLWGMLGGGHDHQLVVFGVNASHNLIHLVSGAAALVTAMIGEQAAMIFCLIFGSVYGLVAVAGFFMVPAVTRMLNLNLADNFLHLAISIACLWMGGQSKGK
jgi:uncharacterized protein DUF4383